MPYDSRIVERMKRVKALVITTMLAASGMGMGMTAADAAMSDCGANRMCVWGNNDFKWMLDDRPHGSKTKKNLTGDKNDEMDSWANRSATYRGCMYEHNDGGGSRWYMAKNSNDNNVGPSPSDDVSSWNTNC